MIILMSKGKVHCIKTFGDRKKSKEDLMAEEAELYAIGLKGASKRFKTKTAQKAFIDKVAAIARS